MNNYTCLRVMAVYIIIDIMYELCMLIRYLVSITQVLKDSQFWLIWCVWKFIIIIITNIIYSLHCLSIILPLPRET
jgi:hypothetical protein